MDYRALEERRNEALTKRSVVKIGNNWRKFKGEKLEDDTRNPVGSSRLLGFNVTKRLLYIFANSCDFHGRIKLVLIEICNRVPCILRIKK